MSAETDREDPSERAGRIEAAVILGRRRLLRGGLSAAPVIMTLASGPVSAGLCATGSAYGSLNPSGKHASLTCGGRSPAIWQNTNNGHWPIKAAALFGTHFKPALSDIKLTLKAVVDPSGGYDPVARNLYLIH